MKSLLRLNGVFPIYKPKNLTSAECCNLVKRSLIKELVPSLQSDQSLLKVGHGGTLDKDAEGVLAIGIGAGCKQLTSFIHGPKTYLCDSVMGLETDTGYLTGTKINSKSYVILLSDHVTQEEFIDSLNQFVGHISQVPPVFSALKYKGRRLSDLAYAGEAIPQEKLAPRRVTVFSIRCLTYAPPHFTLEISCGGGCYVRSIIKDLTHALNTCAFVSRIERTVNGPFEKKDSLNVNLLNYTNVLAAMKSYKL